MNPELERFDPAEQMGRISYEHLHRYALCREHVGGRRVLDMGCGTGYGTAILARAAANVVGIDLGDDAIAEARRRYGSAANLEYLQGDCYALPFDDGEFDVVVANEIIEHVTDHDAFVSEARRVLKADGLFLVSTPNKPVYNRYKPPNVFHVSEMDIPEFRELLHRYFAHVRLTGTRMALVSVGFDLNGPAGKPGGNSASAAIYRGTGPGASRPGIEHDMLRLTEPEYVLAICATREPEAAEETSSIFYSRDDDLWLEHEKIMAWASGLHEEDEQLRADFAGARAALEAVETRAAALETRATTLAGDLADAEVRSAELAEDLDATRARLARASEVLQAQARQRNLVAEQRAIRAELAGAQEALAACRSHAPAASARPWKHRLLGLPAPLRTAIFNNDWIARMRPDLGSIRPAAFVANPRLNAVDPHPLFCAREYLANNPDVGATGLSPLRHYVEYGWREGRNPHPWFANDWYLQQNPDVLAEGTLNPLDHYLQHGWREGRRPNPVFDLRAYLDRNADVAQADTEPLTHYLMYGEAEGREIGTRRLDPDWRQFVPAEQRALSPMDYLLRAPVTNVFPAPSHLAEVPEAVWPPAPLGDHWAPHLLRNFIIEGYGEESFGLYRYALSVMSAFQNHTEAFPSSDECARIVARLRALAHEKAPGTGDAPDASIIVPVYNNILDTLLCLLTVLEAGDAATFEIIVADDGSTDATQQLVSGIGGAVRYLRQPANLGFLGNCNAAAAEARGRYLVLLNNDTLVMPQWLDHLLAPFDALEDIGFTGAKLINWDGTLQEAGGIFWQDGSAWNFGRGREDARASEFSYLHDVDYCSGAAIAVPVALWREVHGFDPLFMPAYCEDSDLAFRLRARGWRTVLAPQSEVIHHEGRSHGRDVSSGIKAYQVTNQQRLFDRWRDVLARENYPNGENVLRARDRSRARRHILVVDHYVPQWDRDAGSRTIRQFIDALLDDGWAVTFWPDNLYRDPNYAPVLQARGVEVIHGPRFAGGFARFLVEREGFYDAVLLSRPHISEKYIEDVRRLTSARIVYYGHDVHFQRMIAQRDNGDATVGDAAIEAQRRQELDICTRSDAFLYPSHEEAELMGGLVSSSALAMSVPAYSFPQPATEAARKALATLSKRRRDVADLLFVGGFAHTPNVDGIIWFCNEVLPILRDEGLNCKLRIVGSNPKATIWGLERSDVEVLGFVSDEQLAELYREASVVVAPLRYGAGVKGKVVEAMANGVPVATTNVGAQGLEGADGFLFIGDTPEALAGAIKAALNPDAARSHATAALDYVENHYSPAAIRAALRTALAVTQ